jgi:hypothetical protein
MARRWNPAKTAPPFTKGNLAAVKSGAHSKAIVAPIREKLVVDLRLEYPTLSDAEVWLCADRLAKIELAAAFIDEHGLFRDKEQGEVWPVVDRLERWANRAENILRAARQEKQGNMPVIDLSDVQDDN